MSLLIRLKPKEAQEVINRATGMQRTELAKNWGPYIVLDKAIKLSQNAFSQLVEDCNDNQLVYLKENFRTEFKRRPEIGTIIEILSGGDGAFGADGLIGTVIDPKEEKSLIKDDISAFGGICEGESDFIVKVANKHFYWRLNEFNCSFKEL